MKTLKYFGIICMLLGLAMVAGSGWLIFQNNSEEAAAGELTASVKEDYLR